ncbi:TetR/AcrR family transcriptional regulator [Novosphingobium mathurense]|uniref:Transcriptional regulator, TetR family n=1 Tax=Novosphingobium mathurense TaxID=428990 RepID=A0A1U6HJX2_9SPHN|nr:TetR/AcrR family transcriptional regulator [Novosphingobium mathurense]SLJ96027.1 transcriptional regulator, TetR family [Novosphingobium mathurense]
MTTGKSKKRGQGRPIASKNGVGRDALIAATCKLLQDLPPAQVTIAAVGREAGVDPALIRYYFGNREALLFEVAQRLANPPEVLAIDADIDPIDQLEAFIHAAFAFTRSAKYMQRLMTEELSEAKSPEIQQKLREWQKRPVSVYEAIRQRDGGDSLAEYDPLFLHLAVVGMSDFFRSGASVVKMLAPEGEDLAELEKRYEAFVVRVLLDGLRRRES